ncbi:unnamed protein product [Onchocerca flexuosa]|uniref:Uncharacterized protein n=1 Tax=Onchocerca flexuosa TaxID=387005 RepID=A0A3P8EQD3_9BILA|nr:unnamed protein product [Onchocerca flexuosa]
MQGWSSPFPLSPHEHDSPKTAITETAEILKTGNSDRNENYINTQATRQPSVSWIEKSAKMGLSTSQTSSSTTPGRGIFERDCDLPGWLNANGNQTDHYDVEVKPSIQTNRNSPSDILVKAHGCIKLALQAPTPITFNLTGLTASREIRVRKLFVNGQEYVFV